ncbi:MAG: N-acetylneuraminate lyase [Eubacteriales bacterium]|nr:N-acetylneuraminate lyase [Eubacteriales bacterium]
MKTFKGIFPALLTPFYDDGTINKESLKKLIEMNLDKGVSGFYVGGSTAEAFLLEVEVRRKLLKIAKEIAKDRCTLIAHVGSISTEQAITLAKQAEMLKYDAISAIPPFYYKFGFEQIKKYYMDIVKSVNLPMIIYMFPAFSGVSLTVENIAEILKDERIIGIKFTSNDFYLMERIKTMFKDKLLYNGYDEMFISGLLMGADGGIGSTYNFMSEKFIKMMDYINNGENGKALELQREANNIIEALMKVGVLEGEKEILNLLGIDFGLCRPPFKTISKEESAFLREAVLPYVKA